MKYQHFFSFWIILGILLFQLIVNKLFDTNIFELLLWWILKGENKLVVTFLLGLGGLTFLSLISSRTFDVYLSFTGKPQSYVFTGDRLQEGFYGYLEKDRQQKEVFVPSFLDNNIYPAASFNALYQRKIVLKNSQGNVVKLDFFRTGNLILWTIFTLTAFMFSFAGILMLLKSYAEGQGHHLNSAGGEIEGIWQFANEKSGGMLKLFVWSIIMIHVFSILIIKLNTRDIPNDNVKLKQLPDAVKEGNLILGKVLAHDKHAPLTSDDSKHEAIYYKTYTIQFDKEVGFEPSVYVNWEAQDINDRNLQSRTSSLKAEMRFKKTYYDKAFDKLEKAKETGEYLPFMVIDHLCIVPYLEEEKELIPRLLELERN